MKASPAVHDLSPFECFSNISWWWAEKSANQKLRPAAIIDSDITLSPEMYHHGIDRILWIHSSLAAISPKWKAKDRTSYSCRPDQKWQDCNMLHSARQGICDVRGMQNTQAWTGISTCTIKPIRVFPTGLSQGCRALAPANVGYDKIRQVSYWDDVSSRQSNMDGDFWAFYLSRIPGTMPR